MNDTALSQQVGGSHYKDMAIQPVEFIEKNNLGFCAGNVIKYICRYKNKNGIEDLKKARHYIDILIDLESEHVYEDESQCLSVPQASNDVIESSPVENNLTDGKEDFKNSVKVENAISSINFMSSTVDNILGSCANPDCVGDPDNYKPTTTPER